MLTRQLSDPSSVTGRTADFPRRSRADGYVHAAVQWPGACQADSPGAGLPQSADCLFVRRDWI